MASEPPPPSSTPSAAPGCQTPSDQIPAESSVKSVTGAETSDPAAITASSQPSATAVTQQNSATAQNFDKDKEQLLKVPATSHPPQLQQPQTLSAQQQQQQPPPPLPLTSPQVQSPQPQGSRPSSPRAIAPPTLCINPNKAVFTTAGGVSKHLLINKSADRLAIKIRSSNNFFFRVNPVYSFLDCNAVNELEVIRLIGGGAKHDKLQVIYVTCTENDTDATKLFGLRAKVRSVILPIVTTAA